VVRLRAKTHATKRCRLSVRPALPKLPIRKPCEHSKVKWRVHVPSNGDATTQRYRFALKAIGAHHKSVTRHRTVRQAPTTHPPAITSFTPSRTSVPFVGGNIKLTALLAHTRKCRLSADPTVAGLPPATLCGGAKKSWHVTLPANAAMTPVTYQITLHAKGSHSRQTSETTPVTVGAHPPPCPGQTSTAAPTTTAYFNDPSTGDAADQPTVVNAEINLICDAQFPVHGEVTQISVGDFIYQLEPVTQALLWAHHYMHANVRVVLDGSNNVMPDPTTGAPVANPAYDDLVAGLPQGSVHLCGPNAGQAPPPNGDDDEPKTFPSGTACAGNNIVHAKLLTVSAVDAARHPAIFTSSQNLSQHAIEASLNNGLQIVGDQALYALNASYLAGLTVDAPRPDFGADFSTAPSTANGATITGGFFPQNSPAAFPATTDYDAANDAATDPVVKLLSRVDCTNPGANAGAPTGTGRQTTVRLAMFKFAKRDSVTTALKQLEAAGCDVQIIYSSMSNSTLSDLQSAGIQPVQLDDDNFPYSDGSGTGRVFVHDKYLLISGGLRASGTTQVNQDLVDTGSPNLTQKSLHFNDEAFVEYQQTASAGAVPRIYGDYLANWEHLLAVAQSVT
jgi:hypothetical protein